MDMVCTQWLRVAKTLPANNVVCVLLLLLSSPPHTHKKKRTIGHRMAPDSEGNESYKLVFVLLLITLHDDS